MQTNEIRDYIERAPKRWSFSGARMVNHTHARFKWLTDVARGTLNERINRRAGITDPWLPWKNPVQSSIRRNWRNELRKRGLIALNHNP